jgi:membrane protein implicated in regulation of membrane protease activity
MVLAEGITIGWMLILLGAVLLLVEVHSPGFFATVPATVMIILGVLLMLGIDIFSSGWGILVGVIAALIAAGVTVWFYSRMTLGVTSPTTVSRDSLTGREGVVTKETDPVTLSGKVAIASTEWSARSASGTIPAGKRVRVVRSEGVHIVVEEVQ